MKPLRFFALAVCCMGLGACQTFEGVKKDFESIKLPSLNNATAASAEQLVYSGNCPSAHAVEELSTLSEFTDVNDQSEHNLVARVKMTNLQSACNYDERGVTVDVRMDFAGALGPQGRAPASFSYPFFVAITSAGGEILAKEIFAAPLDYAAGQTASSYTEKLRQIIPIENKDRGAHYKVLVGFQLTPDQLAYNRKAIAAEKLRLEAEAALQKQREMDAKKQQKQAVHDAQEPQTVQQSYVSRPVTITP